MSKPYVLGIDIGGTNTVFGIVDARGLVVASSSIKTQKHNNIDDYIDELYTEATRLIDANDATDKIHGIVCTIMIIVYKNYFIRTFYLFNTVFGCEIIVVYTIYILRYLLTFNWIEFFSAIIFKRPTAKAYYIFTVDF